MEFYWFLPTHGDGERLGELDGNKRCCFDYWSNICRAAEAANFRGILVPVGEFFEDSWTTAAALSKTTSILKFLVAVRPSMVSPVWLARQMSTFDRIAPGQLAINVVVGGNQFELARDGVLLNSEQRYEQADEFLKVLKGVLSSEPTVFSGRYYSVNGAKVSPMTNQFAAPQIFAAGASEPGMALAARWADVYLLWADPVPSVRVKIERLSALALAHGRAMKFGIRVHFVIDATVEGAWAEADRLLGGLSPDDKEAALRRFAREEAWAAKEIVSRVENDSRSLEIAPNLWAGVSLARGGALTAIVGDAATVHGILNAYEEAGVDFVIGSATPHLEGISKVADALLW